MKKLVRKNWGSKNSNQKNLDKEFRVIFRMVGDLVEIDTKVSIDDKRLAYKKVTNQNQLLHIRLIHLW